MVKLSKRMQLLRNKVNNVQQYDIMNAISLHQKLSVVNFNESIDVAINLGIDPRRSDQSIRGFVFLPYGTGRKMRIAAFTQGMNMQHAKTAGADEVGMEDLADRIRLGDRKFDVVVASPDAMYVVSKLAPILGPRGLMPSSKIGTLSQNLVDTIKNVKLGQISYRNDKYGIVHMTIGKMSFLPMQLKGNLEVVIAALKKNKPLQVKGVFIKKVTLSSTMGIGIDIDQNSLLVK
ncbi:50S ribosomal protein L1 [Blochmannia endosymbiont of Camponotus (Colobopsis) obliquus]|uniref:50S ribosomal protein L1 n=1 Tax=Blochmannia endosymbiont of Camponotus (Colobopsis) obliquus TaxID=1505597 RepID=UPI00061A5502|nr:50S ribosomal protein L1 [Blochmannia endosymbiont of Camponotus (Colobopsis) obliquus]AKC60705.1 50S ribosomal protein L1 [Blochmannia endosymbiont of Camponotus (Colobopsis) obliquus]